ncbi:MAG: ABC transporter permease [Spirochaetales bacterium]|nr:ABC transporter permease [Spirochaetales bacterium]
MIKTLIDIFNDLVAVFTQSEIIYRTIGSVILLGLLIAFSLLNKLKLEKAFITGFIRGFIQIALMGSVLIFLFSLENIFVLYMVLLLMCLFAALSSKKILDNKMIVFIDFLSITIGSLGIISFVILLKIIPQPVQGEFVIPLGSMVISNAMVMNQIYSERLFSEIRKSQGFIEAALSLGDSPSHAVSGYMKQAIRAALVPTTKRMATLGIVTIPGLMSGMIVGGINPIEAAVYQVIIFLMILCSAFISILICGFFSLQFFFNSRDQLRMEIYLKKTD